MAANNNKDKNKKPKTEKGSKSTKPSRKYNEEQLKAREDTVRAIYDYYEGDITPRQVNSIVGNIEVESAFLKKNLKEGQYSWKNLQENPNLVTVREKLAKWGGGKEEYDKLSHDEKLSVMYWGDTEHTKTAGGRGSIQLTSAGYGGNHKTDEDVRKAVKELGLDLDTVHDDFYTSTLTALKVFDNRGKDLKEHATSPMELRKSVVNPYEKLDPEKDAYKIQALSFYDTEESFYDPAQFNTKVSEGSVSVNPEQIEKNPTLDDGQKEELLKINESQGVEPETVQQLNVNKPSILHELGAYTGYQGQVLNEDIVDKDGEAKKKKLAEENAKRAGQHSDISAFGKDFNLLDHEFNQGGDLNMQRQSDAVTEYNAGGSHEQNPQGGIPIGQNPQGGRNLVEQGETRHGDYIYSNEHTLDKNFASRFNLSPKYIGKSYSDISRDINEEIKNRPYDNITKKTASGNLNKLMLAQETLKQQKELEQAEATGQLQSQPQPQHGDEAFWGGGILASGVQGALDANKAGIAADGSATGLLGKAGGAMGIAGDVIDLAKYANTAFGKTGIDTSGTGGRQAQVKNAGVNAAIEGAQGFMSGMKYGPLGGIIKGGLAVGSSLMGSENKRNDIAENNRNANYIANNEHHSTFRSGGSLFDIEFHEGGGVKHSHRQDDPKTPGFSTYRQNDLNYPWMNKDPQTPEFDHDVSSHKTDPSHKNYNPVRTWGNDGTSWVSKLRSVFFDDNKPQPVAQQPEPALQPMQPAQPTGPMFGPDQNAAPLQTNDAFTLNDPDYFKPTPATPELATNPIAPVNENTNPSLDGFIPGQFLTQDNIGQINALAGYEADAANQDMQDDLNDLEAEGKYLNGLPGSQASNTTSEATGQTGSHMKGMQPSELLRYSSVIGNMAQYFGQKDPEVEKYDRVDSRYQPQYVDERMLENRVANSAANTRNALQNTYGGSAGAARAGLLASHLNESNALSGAMAQAQQANRDENTKAQTHNTKLDMVNQQIGMQETIANSQNRAAADNYKKMLLNQTLQDLGSIGKEKSIENILGNLSGYDKRGNKIQPKDGESNMTSMFDDLNPEQKTNALRSIANLMGIYNK